MWKSEDKILYVLMKIKRLEEISPKGDKLELIHYEAFGDEFSVKEVKLILRKLEKDYSAIRELEMQKAIDPTGSVMLNYYWFYINYKNFDNVYDKYWKKCDISESMDHGKLSKITYDEINNKLYLNEELLRSPQDGSLNECFIRYVCKHPNQWIELEDIKRENGKPVTNYKCINNILNDLGFKKDRKNAFFKIKKNKIYFENPARKKL